MSKRTSIYCMAAANVYFVAVLFMGFLMISGVLDTRGLKTAHAHLGLLGWLSLTIMGAMYEQVPNLTAADLYSKRTAWWSFWVYNLGLVGLASGFALGGSGPLMVGSSVLLLVGIYAFAGNIFLTVKNRRAPNPIVKFYSASALYFVLAATFGGVLAMDRMGVIDLIDLFGPVMYTTAHAHLGFLGWAALIIIGAMSWMFPMVVMRDIHSQRLMEYVFWLFNLGLLGFFSGLLTGGLGTLSLMSAGAAFLAIALFAYDMLMTALKKQVKMQMTAKSTEAPFFYASVAYFVLVGLLGIAMVLRPETVKAISPAHAHLALLGFVSLTIMGGMYHLIPMLSWTLVTKKMASRPPDASRGPLPKSLHELYSERLSKVVFWTFNLGTLALAAGMYLGSQVLGTGAGIVILASGLLFSGDMFRCMKRGL
jgi:cbb3-type cytochrome oxidase subunit 1